MSSGTPRARGTNLQPVEPSPVVASAGSRLAGLQSWLPITEELVWLTNAFYWFDKWVKICWVLRNRV